MSDHTDQRSLPWPGCGYRALREGTRIPDPRWSRAATVADQEDKKDHSAHTPLTASELNGETLAGAKIYDTDDNTIGTVSHLHGTGPGAEIILDVGGFLGIGSKPVALPVMKVTTMRDEAGTVHGLSVSTKEDLKSLPAHHRG